MSAGTGWDRRLRVRLAVLGLALFVYLTAEMFPVGALPEIAAGLRVRDSTAGLLLSGYAVAAGVAAIPVVVWLNPLDRRTVLAAALVLLAVSQFALAAAPGFGVALAARALAALAPGYVWAVVPVVASTLAPEGARGRATATVFVGSTAGLVIGSPLAAALSQGVGWRAAAAVIGAAGGAVAVLVRVVLPPLVERPDRAGTASRPAPWCPVGLICVVTAVAATAHYVSYTYLALLVDPVGVTGAGYAALIAAYGVAGLVGVRLVGRSIDRRPGLTALVVFCVLAAALGGLGPALAGGAAVVAVGLVLLWAAAFSAAPAVLQDAVLRAAPDHGDTASAAYVVAFQIGIAGGSASGALALGRVPVTDLPVLSAVVATGALLVQVAIARHPSVRRPVEP